MTKGGGHVGPPLRPFGRRVPGHHHATMAAPVMIKEIFHIGSFSISPFGVMLVLAFLASYLQLRWGMKRLGIGDEEDASAIVFAAGLGGILGAKIYYAILNR